MFILWVESWVLTSLFQILGSPSPHDWWVAFALRHPSPFLRKTFAYTLLPKEKRSFSAIHPVGKSWIALWLNSRDWKQRLKAMILGGWTAYVRLVHLPSPCALSIRGSREALMDWSAVLVMSLNFLVGQPGFKSQHFICIWQVWICG